MTQFEASLGLLNTNHFLPFFGRAHFIAFSHFVLVHGLEISSDSSPSSLFFFVQRHRRAINVFVSRLAWGSCHPPPLPFFENRASPHSVFFRAEERMGPDWLVLLLLLRAALVFFGETRKCLLLKHASSTFELSPLKGPPTRRKEKAAESSSWRFRRAILTSLKY